MCGGWPIMKIIQKYKFKDAPGSRKIETKEIRTDNIDAKYYFKGPH